MATVTVGVHVAFSSKCALRHYGYSYWYRLAGYHGPTLARCARALPTRNECVQPRSLSRRRERRRSRLPIQGDRSTFSTSRRRTDSRVKTNLQSAFTSRSCIRFQIGAAARSRETDRRVANAHRARTSDESGAATGTAPAETATTDGAARADDDSSRNRRPRIDGNIRTPWYRDAAAMTMAAIGVAALGAGVGLVVKGNLDLSNATTAADLQDHDNLRFLSGTTFSAAGVRKPRRRRRPLYRRSSEVGSADPSGSASHFASCRRARELLLDSEVHFEPRDAPALHSSHLRQAVDPGPSDLPRRLTMPTRGRSRHL